MYGIDLDGGENEYFLSPNPCSTLENEPWNLVRLM